MGVPGLAPRLIVRELPRPGESAHLDAAEAAHARAFRLRTGDRVVLLDGTGRIAEAVVRVSEPDCLEVAVESWREPSEETPQVTILVCGVRPERLDWIAEKATELGASRIVLVVSERVQSFRAHPAGIARMEKVARAAAKQSESARWPEIAGPVDFERALAVSAANRFLLDPAGEPFPKTLEPGACALLVGPEGGWSDAERHLSLERGWRPISLPAGKLRSETAAVAGLTLLRSVAGRSR
jgi:16S rRNA (uracil1498-N3)-methyltransferase